MNVARGGKVFSLLQKGFGARAGSTLANRHFIGGFQVPATTDKDDISNSSLTIGTKSIDFQRRFMSTPARKGNEEKDVTPTMATAKAVPLSCREMANSDLVMLGAMGNSDARKEILIRHIMAVDEVAYETAAATFDEIAEKNREGMWLLTVPYKAGVAVAVVFAAGSLPMVFEFGTVEWFNELYVTADVPEPKDLETPLEVGSWAWNWMEPPLGTLSFMLLCLQYIRAQIDNLGIRPYTSKIMSMRAEKLANLYPQYDAKTVMAFSESVSFYSKHGIKHVAGVKTTGN